MFLPRAAASISIELGSVLEAKQSWRIIPYASQPSPCMDSVVPCLSPHLSSLAFPFSSLPPGHRMSEVVTVDVVFTEDERRSKNDLSTFYYPDFAETPSFEFSASRRKRST